MHRYKGKFMISSNLNSPSTIIISDISGKIILNKNNVILNQLKFTFQTKPGFYNVQLKDKDNQIFTQKPIIQ